MLIIFFLLSPRVAVFLLNLELFFFETETFRKTGIETRVVITVGRNEKKEREIRNLIASCNGRSGYVSAYVHTVYIYLVVKCVSYILSFC